LAIFYLLNVLKILILNKIKYLIHARNIAGLGSIKVVSNLLISLSKHTHFANENVTILLPDINIWRSRINFSNTNWEVIFKKRHKFLLTRFFFSAFELFFNNFENKYNYLITLGDIPIRSKIHQTLLFHNTNIISNTKSIKFILINKIFKFNFKYIDKCIVQTEIVKNDLILLFPNKKFQIFDITMPVSKSQIDNIGLNFKNTNKVIRLFYPASYNTHKNHSFFFNLIKFKNNHEIFMKFEFHFTINRVDIKRNILKIIDENNLPIFFLGTLNYDEVLTYYKKIDSLFFLSKYESYGLPLIEAMNENKYIICPNLPYSKFLCENKGIYFNINDNSSLITSLLILKSKFKSNKNINWDNELLKITNNWDIYVSNFYKVCYIQR